MFRDKSINHPPNFGDMYSEDEIGALQCVPPREREIVYFYDATRKKPEAPYEEVLDLSQYIDRTPIAQNCTPCITPGSKLWLRRRFRLVKPNERLMLQGLPLYTFDDLNGFSANLINDLAGNAFCGFNIVAWFVSLHASYDYPFSLQDEDEEP